MMAEMVFVEDIVLTFVGFDIDSEVLLQCFDGSSDAVGNVLTLLFSWFDVI